MELLVKNGEVATADGIRTVDVLCRDGRIAAVAAPGELGTDDTVLDATGQLVLPGFIDPHVHSRDPGMTHKEDFEHATRGALLGGVTTVLEMPNAIPPVDSVEQFHDRAEHHGRSAWTDFGLWGLVSGEESLAQIAPLFEAGAVALKVFWGYALRKDTKQLVYNSSDTPASNLLPPPDNGTLRRVFAEVAAAGGLLAAHCEDRDILNGAAAALGHDITTYDDLLAARPAVAEAASIALAAQLSAETGCRFHVVHMASAAGANAVRMSREAGIRITAETCPQYLTLTQDDYPRVGPVMKVYPPVRGSDDQAALWDAVRSGTIVSVGSDHAPHTVEEKAKPLSTQPAGAVGCETLGPLMIDAALRGRITVRELVAIMSKTTAELYGLDGRKGTIAPGYDADLVLVDPQGTTAIRNESLVAKQPVSPWHGWDLQGSVQAVVLRGEVAAREGDVVGPRRGRFLRAQHSPN